MSLQTKNMIKSWAGTFVSAVIAALLAILTTTGEIPMDGQTWLSILVAGIVSVLPVIKNYLDTSYLNYGRVGSPASE